jgi:ribosomal protein S18 acetylase RimI-like enzyme
MPESETTRLEASRGEYSISTDRARLDVDAIHGFLTTAYWSEGIGRDLVALALDGSLCFGLYHGSVQVGLARVVTDRATFAYLCDVYVLASHRGRGLGEWLIETVMSHPNLQGLRRFSLVTKDAQGLYRKFGFTEVAGEGRHMEIARAGLYLDRSDQL